MCQSILFLGYDETQTRLIDALVADGHALSQTDAAIDNLFGYDIAVSFGYKKILPPSVIANAPCPIVNLHIGYLPYNRGMHPNFWSFYDRTPSGVTIHLIDAGIDTGDIICQKYVDFAADEQTFRQTYQRLIAEIEALFLKHRHDIVWQNFTAVPQPREGSCHRLSDLPKDFSGWDAVITDEVARLRAMR